MTFEQMKNVDVRTVDPDTLVDINDVKINMDLPKRERMLDAANRLGNPYCFKCGNITVKLGYSETTVTIDDRMESFMRSL